MRCLAFILLFALVVGCSKSDKTSTAFNVPPRLNSWQQPNTTSADWPQFRGQNRDGVSHESGLLSEWPAGGLDSLWVFSSAGEGFSAPSIANNVVYMMGTKGNKSAVFALGLETGVPLWEQTIDGMFRDSYGNGPRCTPTVDGNRLYVLTGNGTLACLDATSGQIVWRKSLTSEFGGKVPTWGYSESPLVDGNKVICQPGGSQCIVALDKETGKKIWSSSGLSDSDSYTSLISRSMKNHHGGVVIVNGKAYGYEDGEGWVCQDVKTGEVHWRDRSLDKGSIIYADGKFYCYTQRRGEVVLNSDNGKGWTSHGSFTISKSSNRSKWSHPVIAQGRLFIRDQNNLFCYKVK